MRKDIIRGVRWALVFSVVAIASIGADRMIRSTPAEAKPVAELPPVVVSTHEAQVPVPEPPALKSAVPQPVPATRPAPVAVKFDAVPLPPSLPPLEPDAFARPAPPKVVAAVRTQETRASVVETPAAPVVSPEPIPERVTNYVETDEKAAAANPAKRAIRSVGRVLGIGKKEKEATPAGGK